MPTHDRRLAINGGRPVSLRPIPLHKPFIDEEDYRAVHGVLKDGFIGGDGPACREFEERLAAYLGVKHVLFTTSCTAALDLAFRTSGIAPGKEVLVPDYTFTSTALGALLNGLSVRLVDVDPRTGNVDADRIRARITRDTEAVVPVDYAGNPAEMESIADVCERHGLRLIHDAAQSIGAECRGRKTGAAAAVSVFSFHSTKNLSTGEGGAFVTNDDAVASRARTMRDKGTDRHCRPAEKGVGGFCEYISIGNSYVQSDLNAALGLSQLNKLDWMNGERRRIAKYYAGTLSELPFVQIPPVCMHGSPNWHIFYILVPEEWRDWIVRALIAEGVCANSHYLALHRNRFYAALGADHDFPDSISFSSRVIRLPIHPSLSQEDQELVVQAVRKVVSTVHRSEASRSSPPVCCTGSPWQE